MVTLEDAAEQLVLKLRGMDAEIEESSGAFDDLRERVEKAKGEVERHWSELREAASSLLDTVGEEREQLRTQGQGTEQALADAQNAVAEEAAHAGERLGEGHGRLESLGRHAAGLEEPLESLASEAGEAPARTLAERAHELEQELGRLVQEARDFLVDEVAGAAADTADEIRQTCDTLQQSLTASAATAFQDAYQDWESTVDALEDYVVSEGYKASHPHANAVVEYAVKECDRVSDGHVDALKQVVAVLEAQLVELAGELEQAADRLVAQAGAPLVDEIENTARTAAAAVSGLDAVKRELAQYAFVEM